MIPATNVVVCRLTASIEAMKRRVEMRDLGILQHEYVARVAKLNLILNRARLENFAVINEERSLTDVALRNARQGGMDFKLTHYSARSCLDTPATAVIFLSQLFYLQFHSGPWQSSKFRSAALKKLRK
jgi:hypothetical protein